MRLCWISVIILEFLVHGVLLDVRYLSCKTPTLKYGRIRSRQRGRTIKFVCNTGYQLAGERMAFCRNQEWDVPIPKCVRGTCAKKDSPPTNGLVLPSHSGAVLNFYCKQGYELNGPGAVFCDGFNWDNHKPSCIPSHTKPKLFCDFEDVDICQWTHDLNHDMDWVRDSYKTPTGYSMETGPSHDHTKGNGSNGHYMYIESSSRRINDTARLISPIFGMMEGNVCLEFWYHMYGRTTGTLRAYMKKLKDPWPLNPTSAVFSKSGNQGNVWYREIIDLGHIPDQFQIVMEGVRGNGYVSDIAVDDINIIPNCTYEDHIPSTTEFFSIASEVLKTVESCDGRCGQKALGNESSQLIPCDCDDFCDVNSRCCPDYIDVCLSSLPTLEWTTTSDTYVGTTQEPPVANNATSKNTLPANTTSTPKSTMRPQTLAVIKVTPRSVKPIIPVATLHFLQPPTTPKVVEIIVPKFPQSKNTSKIIFVRPKTTTTVRAYHDDIEVPTKAGNDEELLLTSPVPVEDDNNDINDVSLQDKEDYVEKITNEKDYPFKISDVDHEHVGEIKTEFRQVQEEHSLVVIPLIAVCSVVVLSIIAGVALVKFRCVQFRNKRMSSGQGDSQSDVRFLTADEVLDFNLDKDYDEL